MLKRPKWLHLLKTIYWNKASGSPGTPPLSCSWLASPVLPCFPLSYRQINRMTILYNLNLPLFKPIQIVCISRLIFFDTQIAALLNLICAFYLIKVRTFNREEDHNE